MSATYDEKILKKYPKVDFDKYIAEHEQRKKQAALKKM